MVYWFFLVSHKSAILVPLGWRDADDGRVENAEFAYLRSSSPNGNGNMLTAKLHPDRSDVDNNWFKSRTGIVPFGVMANNNEYIFRIMFSLSDIFTAYYDCRQYKRNTIGALEFELHYERECIALWDEIESRTYRFQPCTAFIVRDPVQREIFASHFRDRVVHHLIARRLTPILERALIHDIYNSRRGKWTHYGIDRVDHFMRSCSENYSRDAYVLKLDISGFFMSIDREILWNKIETLIMRYIDPDEQDILLYLIRTIICTDVRKDVKIVGKKEDWVWLPRSKSLFCARQWCGLPIGNLTSQLFANIYMHEFDTFVKKILKVKYYGRYVDDFILIHTDSDYLRSCIPMIREFLREQLGLTLHPRKMYFQHISKWVLFLGTFIKPYRKYIGKRTKWNYYELIWNINIRLSDPTRLSDLEQDRILAQMNSYLGLLSHTQSYRLRSKMMSILDERFLEYFQLDEAYTKILVKK